MVEKVIGVLALIASSADLYDQLDLMPSRQAHRFLQGDPQVMNDGRSVFVSEILFSDVVVLQLKRKSQFALIGLFECI